MELNGLAWRRLGGVPGGGNRKVAADAGGDACEVQVLRVVASQDFHALVRCCIPQPLDGGSRHISHV